ncbi:MAG: hypothetical protein JO057_29650 [Chloroflexi bacterium]|nr:hypothetical protein [Chloroflexota bacterium]
MPLRRLGHVDHAHVARFEDQQEARAAFPDAWAAGRSAPMHDSVARAIDNAQRLQAA